MFASAADFLSSGPLERVGCLVLDVQMPGITGPELQAILARSASPPPIIFVTSRTDDALRARILSRGARAVLYKPFDPDTLLALVAVASR